MKIKHFKLPIKLTACCIFSISIVFLVKSQPCLASKSRDKPWQTETQTQGIDTIKHRQVECKITKTTIKANNQKKQPNTKSAEFAQFQDLITDNKDYCYLHCNRHNDAFLIWLKDADMVKILHQRHSVGIDDSFMQIYEFLKRIKNKKTKNDSELVLILLKSSETLVKQLLHKKMQFIILAKKEALLAIEKNGDLMYRDMSTAPACTKKCKLKNNSWYKVAINSTKSYEQFMRSIFLL